MKVVLIYVLAAFLSPRYALLSNGQEILNQPRQEGLCENNATSRGCWGAYDINTNYYLDAPDTGITREYWLSVVNTTLAPDGYARQVLTFNGTIPGPTLEANWGDTFVIHITNNLADNGTAIHWHGLRQLHSSEFDGVPGVTQCPIAPGNTMTYRFKGTQYGSSWYHSHFTLQYGDGLLGGIIIHGPATANYDEDLGSLFLSDWSHSTVFQQWQRTVKTGGRPVLENGIINGTNVYDCSGSLDPACLGPGTRFHTTFISGTKYRIRLVNTALYGFIRFAIDGHTFTVISTDFVPIVPYTTDSLVIAIGQRYDIIVEANQPVGNYWLRAIWQTPCAVNALPNNILGIVSYEGADEADPTTSPGDFAFSCEDESAEKLIPHLSLTVGESATEDHLDLVQATDPTTGLFTWNINTTSLYLNWSDPTQLKIINDEDVFPTPYNVYPITVVDKWVYWAINDRTGFNGNTHPLHLHGHDFFILAQGPGIFDPTTTLLNRNNPPRRDTATLPEAGFLVIAFYTDNPGSWLMHCHIAWHASQGFAIQFVEREEEISGSITAPGELHSMCNVWGGFAQVYPQDDSGI